MKSAAAYIRVSTDDQTEYSPDAQLRALKNWALNNGYHIDQEHVYIDEGISGRKAERRPAFMAMIGAAKLSPAPFEVILVHKFDRFARSREDSVVYKSLLKKECGVRVVSITESIEDDKFSIILEAMLEAMAEYYSINLSEEVKKGMTEKARRGERQTAAPFGYRSVNGQLVPDPVEAAAVKYLFMRWAAGEYHGETYFALTRWLNEHGYRTRRGKTFQNRNVRYILSNPTYAGLNAWTANRTHKSNTEYLMSEETILEKGSHEPLIDMELWERAQKRIAELRERFGSGDHKKNMPLHADWISGIVRCSDCDNPMIRNRQGERVYWVCNGYTHGRCPTANGIKDEALKNMLISSIRHDAENQSVMGDTARNALLRTMEPVSYDSILARIDARLNRAREAYQAGVDSIEEYAAAKRALNAEREEILKKMSAPLFDEAQVKALADRFRSDLLALADLLASDAPMSEKHNAVHAAVDRAIWSKADKAFTIVYALTPSSLSL